MTPLPKDAAREIGQTGRALIRRADRWALSLSMLSLALGASLTLPLYFGRDTRRLEAEIDHYRSAHEDCQRRLDRLENKVEALESRLSTAKR